MKLSHSEIFFFRFWLLWQVHALDTKLITLINIERHDLCSEQSNATVVSFIVRAKTCREMARMLGQYISPAGALLVSIVDEPRYDYFMGSLTFTKINGLIDRSSPTTISLYTVSVGRAIWTCGSHASSSCHVSSVVIRCLFEQFTPSNRS